MDYFENLADTMIASNIKALKHRDARAWDNKKAKTVNQCTPRGKAFKKLEKQRSKKWWEKVRSHLVEAQKKIIQIA